MNQSRDDILNPTSAAVRDDRFPNAPVGWRIGAAQALACSEDVDLSDEHFEVIRALQEYYSRRDGEVNVRELHDALDERFHTRGGIKFVYLLFPKGPIAQGCRIAGLKAPAGAVDKGFGSVQ